MMNKQGIEKAIAYWKEFKAEIPELKSSYPDAGLDDQEEFVELAISALTQQLNNGWIPVSERLPEINQNVLVTYGNMDIAVDFIHKDGQWFWEDGEEGLVVLAWHPLPEPYKASTQPTTATE